MDEGAVSEMLERRERAKRNRDYEVCLSPTPQTIQSILHLKPSN